MKLLSFLMMILLQSGFCETTVPESGKNSVDFTSIVHTQEAPDKEILSIYGHEFEVKEIQVEGTPLSWKLIKSYLPGIFPDAREKKLDKKALKTEIEKKKMEKMKVFSKAVSDLAKKMTSLMAEVDSEMIELEIADYLVVNDASALIDKYKNMDKALMQEILQAQELHNQYLATMMLEAVCKK